MEQLKKYASIVYAPSDVVEVRCLHASQPVQSYWTTGADLPGMYDQLKALNGQGYNIYAGVLPRKADGGKTDADTANGHVIWLDFDHVDDIDEFFDITLFNKWQNMPQPTMTINSGHGVHVYWRLTDATDKDAISATTKGLLWTGADKACTNPGRIMRLPGFTNHKDPAAECTILSTTDNTYAITDFEPFLSTQTQTDNAAWAIIPTTPSTIDIDKTRGEAWKWLNQKQRAVKGSRNPTTYEAACAVFDFGLPDDIVLELTMAWNKGNMPPLDDAEVAKIVRSASKNRQNKTPTKGNRQSIHKTTACAPVDITKNESAPACTPQKIVFPEECYNVPGFIGDFMRYTHSISSKPSKMGALTAGIAFMAMLIGKKTSFELEQTTHSNAYIVFIAESGHGKDAGRKAIKSIIQGVMATQALQADKDFVSNHISDAFASGEAIITAMQEQPTRLFLIDEFDTLLKKLADQRSPAAKMSQTIMTMYTSSTTIFIPDDRANRKLKLQTIENPNMCIYGTGTPGSFFDSMASESLVNGFVGRFMVFYCADRNKTQTMQEIKARREKTKHTDAELFNSLVARSWDWLKDESDCRADKYTRHSIMYDESIEKTVDESNLYAESVMQSADPGEGVIKTIWNRFAENRNKLCMIYAASRDGLENPIVDAECFVWADKVAKYCCAMMANEATNRVAVNEEDAKQKEIEQFLRTRGGSATIKHIMRGTSIKDKQMLIRTIDNLFNQNRIEKIRLRNGREAVRLFNDDK